MQVPRSRRRRRLPAPPANVARGHAETPANSDHNLARFEDRPHQTNAATTDGSHHEAASAASVPAANAAPHTPPPESPTRNRRRSIPWAQLLMRVFHLDALACPRCATPMVVLALLSEPDVVRKNLLHRLDPVIRGISRRAVAVPYGRVLNMTVDLRIGLLDTSPAAARVQIEIYRAMPGWRKWQLVGEAIDATRQVAVAGLRSRHPEESSERIRRRLASLCLGPELAERAYGPLELTP